jgi:hypothetical protein
LAGTGSAVRPLTPLLVYAGFRLDRSDDRATLDGIKLPRLLPGLDYRPRPLWSFISRSPSGGEVRRSDRCPSPPGFPRVPPAREVTAHRFDAGMSWNLGSARDPGGPRLRRSSYAAGNVVTDSQNRLGSWINTRC